MQHLINLADRGFEVRITNEEGDYEVAVYGAYKRREIFTMVGKDLGQILADAEEQLEGCDARHPNFN